MVGKQLTKRYTLKKCTLPCTKGALKQNLLKPDDMFYSKLKTWRIVAEVFQFYAAHLIYAFY